MKELLGQFPERYSLDEKLSIISAYKKGGGVQGLADIIDDGDEEDEEEAAGAQGLQGVNENNNNEPADTEEEEEMDIDLDDPEDVKIIEQEFQKLFDNDP